MGGKGILKDLDVRKDIVIGIPGYLAHKYWLVSGFGVFFGGGNHVSFGAERGLIFMKPS